MCNARMGNNIQTDIKAQDNGLIFLLQSQQCFLKFYLDRKAMEGKGRYAVRLFEMKR
jgi:hypothetical protein